MLNILVRIQRATLRLVSPSPKVGFFSLKKWTSENQMSQPAYESHLRSKNVFCPLGLLMRNASQKHRNSSVVFQILTTGKKEKKDCVLQ